VGRDNYPLANLKHPFLFQSTRPRGARPIGGLYDMVTGQFQSTRPRGARLNSKAYEHKQWQCFNPRARVGRDQSTGLAIFQVELFQSTRPRGARRTITV